MTAIYIIAGEASGDQLGGWLMEALRQKNESLQFHGIGGSAMRAQGLSSLFPMQELSLMGFAEILPHIFRIKRRIKQTIADIEAKNPNIVITIDSPGFTFRVVEALRKRGKVTPKFVHYVAPTVWAYKPERAIKTAALFDHLLVLLPFEPPYFNKTALPTHFVGHAVAWWWKEKAQRLAFRTQYHIAEAAPLLALFPGSRKGEINHMMPLFRATCEKLKNSIPNLETAMLVRQEMLATLQPYIENWPCPLHITHHMEEKKPLFAACDAALAKSGTIGLECALAGLPGVITYRAHPISAWYIRKKIRTPFVNLANILCREMVMPELLQEAATPATLTDALLPLLTNDTKRKEQQRKLSIIPAMLGANETLSPNDKAANIILSLI
jgi:lipid-A-disaccharide synthase